MLRNGAYDVVSEALARRIGAAQAELVGVEPIVHPDDGGAFVPGCRELRLGCSDGWFATRWEVKAAGRDLLLCAVEDLGEARRRLVEADRMAALGTLAAGVAHEINNPLIYVNLHLGRLVSLERSRHESPLSHHRLELLLNMREGLQQIERMVQNLRTFSRAEREPAALDLRAPIEAVLEMASHEIQHRARLVKQLGEVPPVRGDAARLAQAFLDLLLLSAKAIPDGRAEENQLRVSLRAAAGTVVVEIDGSGEVARDAPCLSVARGIIGDYGGALSVEGSRLRVSLPGCAVPPAALPASDLPSALSARILLVDDDRGVASILASILGERHHVVVAGSGREALQVLAEDSDFDAVVCDLMMPEVSGMEVYQNLLASRSAACERFIFATGGAFTPLAQHFLAHVGQPVLEKPFRPADLFAAIDEIVAQKGRRAAR